DEPSGGVQHITWNWDELGVSGANTLCGGALFDIDGDGNADYVVYVVCSGDPAVAADTITYTCNDTRSDRCAGSALAPGQESNCTVTQTNTDPFPAGAGYPVDTTA